MVWFDLTYIGGWTPIDSILQIPNFSFIRMPFRMGSSFRVDQTILSLSLDRRPIPAPYQYVRNDGHTISTETSHNIYSPFLHHDIYRQHNGGLISTNRGGTNFVFKLNDYMLTEYFHGEIRKNWHGISNEWVQHMFLWNPLLTGAVSGVLNSKPKSSSSKTAYRESSETWPPIKKSGRPLRKVKSECFILSRVLTTSTGVFCGRKW